MLAWLWKLIVGDFRQPPQVAPHQHQYEIIHELEKSTYGQINAYIYVSRCKTCGSIREDRVSSK